jgi:predicted NBD/HSP70 family sugar kinase
MTHDPAHVPSVVDAIAHLVGAVEPTPRLVVIGLPGNVNEQRGTVSAASNLGREWDGVVPLAKLVSERLQCQVELRNDTDTAMQGERRRGALVSCNDGALITLSTGVGVCILRNGTQFPAELGHSISQFGGPPCRGRAHAGCYETFLGGWALPDRYRERHPEFTGTHHSDIPDDEAFWNECGRRLGDLVLTLCFSGQPLEAVSFIGSVSLARHHRLLPAVHARVREETALLDVMPRSLRVTPLGEVTSVLGAFLMARDLLFPFLAA